MAADNNSRWKTRSTRPGRVESPPGTVSVPEKWRAHTSRHGEAPARPQRGSLARAVSALESRLAEWLNVGAAYLGIAVLVTLVMVFSIAPLRDQVSQVHQALLE